VPLKIFELFKSPAEEIGLMDQLQVPWPALLYIALNVGFI
jgi:hypothetical protein